MTTNNEQYQGWTNRGDFREVSREEFFGAIGAPLNVHPHNVSRLYTNWELQDGTRKVIGRTEPGWASPYGTPHRYWLAQ